jgi:hypothetical protein
LWWHDHQCPGLLGELRMSGCGMGVLRSASTACVTARAAAAPLRAVPVKSSARSSRCRPAANAASCWRMWPITKRDEVPGSRRQE